VTKTGSTSIQQTLFYENNRQILLKKGYLYPKCWNPNHSRQILSAFSLAPETISGNIISQFTKEMASVYNKNNLTLLLKEINQTAFNHLIISGEMISTMKPIEVKKMKEFFTEKI